MLNVLALFLTYLHFHLRLWILSLLASFMNTQKLNPAVSEHLLVTKIGVHLHNDIFSNQNRGCHNDRSSSFLQLKMSSKVKGYDDDIFKSARFTLTNLAICSFLFIERSGGLMCASGPYVYTHAQVASPKIPRRDWRERRVAQNTRRIAHPGGRSLGKWARRRRHSPFRTAPEAPWCSYISYNFSWRNS